MKKKVALILLTLGLVLTGLMPATIASAKSGGTVASGNLIGITTGTVNPAGDSGRYRVADRVISGIFGPGSFAGAFTLTYHANVVLETQAGNFQGTLTTADGSVLNVNGASQPAQYTGINIPNPYYPYVGPQFLPLYEIQISGHWAVTSGTGTGNGDFNANLVFVPTPDGHIAFVIPAYSDVVLTGSLGQ